MIVRGTATAAKQSHRVLLALPRRAHARSSDLERSAAPNEGAGPECPRLRSGATPASAAATGTLIPDRFLGQCSSGAEAVTSTAAETKGSSKRVTGKDAELTSSSLPNSPSNGEAERPCTSARLAPRAHAVFPRPRRIPTGASRPAPAMVRRRHHPRSQWQKTTKNRSRDPANGDANEHIRRNEGRRLMDPYVTVNNQIPDY